MILLVGLIFLKKIIVLWMETYDIVFIAPYIIHLARNEMKYFPTFPQLHFLNWKIL